VEGAAWTIIVATVNSSDAGQRRDQLEEQLCIVQCGRQNDFNRCNASLLHS